MTREEAIEEIKEEFNEFLKGTGLDNEEYLKSEMKTNEDLRKIVEANRMAIKALEQEPKWIPVSERLPEENGQYLVTVKNLTGYEQLYNNVFECEFFEKDWIFKGWKDNKVIAWMELPEPYKAESEE